MTPNIAIVQIQNPHWRGLKVWLPLFLLWIPLILLLPVILLMIFIICWLGQINFFRAIATFWAISCALPGTDVRVTSEGNNVLVRIL